MEKETNMTTTITTDIAYDYHLADFFEGLEKFSGKLISFISIGPAGGNPNVTIEFPSKEHALIFLKEFVDNE